MPRDPCAFYHFYYTFKYHSCCFCWQIYSFPPPCKCALYGPFFPYNFRSLGKMSIILLIFSRTDCSYLVTFIFNSTDFSDFGTLSFRRYFFQLNVLFLHGNFTVIVCVYCDQLHVPFMLCCMLILMLLLYFNLFFYAK